MKERETKRLSELSYGETGVIREVQDELKNQLVGRGIRIGKDVRMDTKQPIQGPVVFTIERSTTSLGLGLAKGIKVDVKKDPAGTDGSPQEEQISD